MLAVLVQDEETLKSELSEFVGRLLTDAPFAGGIKDDPLVSKSFHGARPFGLDFEWALDAVPNAIPGNPIATVQLACETRALVVHLSAQLAHRMPSCLRNFFNDRRFFAVGCNMRSGDRAKLRAWHGISLPCSLDVGEIDSLVRGEDPSKPRGLDRLVLDYVARDASGSEEEFLKIPLPKKAHAFWSVSPLNETLFQYAARDAIATLAVFRAMESRQLVQSSFSETAAPLREKRGASVKEGPPLRYPFGN